MSLFGSLRDKVSRKSRSRSVSPSPSFSATGPEIKPSTVNEPPPPPYTPVASSSSAVAPPIITVNAAREASPARSFASASSDRSVTSAEDPYAFLSTFDTIFLIDDSSSIQGSRWAEVQALLSSISPICTAHDSNGIDIYFLNAKNTHLHRYSHNEHGAKGYCNITTPSQVTEIFSEVQPRGATPIGKRLSDILWPYVREFERSAALPGNTPEDSGVKPVNMIVITDGTPTDDPESIIISVAKKLDALEAPPHQLGIQFFQVGNDPRAAEYLRDLDDGLAEQANVRDMVDTATWESSGRRALSAEAILKVVLGAVVKRLDRRAVDGSRRGGRLAA
ncbi:uncharacterized protein C8A04DRAFT_29540 [Dichotomopilus funicola]|uniref:VWFA domain-containing protein n=1 Tax=Dichotomopilus funicola TaxID=1934379 RepID=A0AAN6V1L3_9PEZI|nr:hypothetical protein C8A04DRAFT_29540 [Dichotomopilus funicola]